MPYELIKNTAVNISTKYYMVAMSFGIIDITDLQSIIRIFIINWLTIPALIKYIIIILISILTQTQLILKIMVNNDHHTNQSNYLWFITASLSAHLQVQYVYIHSHSCVVSNKLFVLSWFQKLALCVELPKYSMLYDSVLN